MCAYPLFEAVSWYHGGLLLQVHASVLVGAAALADIIAQIILIAVLLYTPLLCHTPIALPVVAAYGGVLTRCSILLAGFHRKVYPKMSKELTAKLSVWKIVLFVAPLMFTLFIQRISRPIINLIIARKSPTKDEAAQAVAVLTASYPLGHLPYGWLNSLKPVSPAFQKKSSHSNKPHIAGKKIAVFCACCLGVSAVVSFVVGWIPGVSVGILVNVVAIPHHLALLCVTPLRIFAFFCFTVSIRASLTGWLIFNHQTKLVAPSGFIRLAATISSLFILPKLGFGTALNSRVY
ncbi:Progressive ankylosis protein [Geodia barretti]|uniref:Progressive ankylosis protein n=1 Tax=Geodia barretti TaxID=519541 RepID=A0AA35SB06_GEOBA|nr:Progressive ankylosis protein [Geodia barretti]